MKPSVENRKFAVTIKVMYDRLYTVVYIFLLNLAKPTHFLFMAHLLAYTPSHPLLEHTTPFASSLLLMRAQYTNLHTHTYSTHTYNTHSTHTLVTRITHIARAHTRDTHTRTHAHTRAHIHTHGTHRSRSCRHVVQSCCASKTRWPASRQRQHHCR